MNPPFTITNTMLNQIVAISQNIGQLSMAYERQLHLRKNHRLRSIQASLAIENNSLSLEQVSDIIDGKRVLGNPKEIQEVKNAYDAYERIGKLKPYDLTDFLHAHRLMTQGLVNQSGQFRHTDVGVFDSHGNVIHMGARPPFIQKAIQDLFAWAKTDDTPALIKSSVMHYEIEVVHPFEDGNGRMGRLWQTVVLADWQPIFAWLPIESIVYAHQSDYYRALGQADKSNNSTVFIEFMLDIIAKTLVDYKNSDANFANVSDKTSGKVSDKLQNLSDTLSVTELQVFRQIYVYLLNHQTVTNAQAQQLLGKSTATVRRYLSVFVAKNLLLAMGENKSRVYRLNDAFHANDE